MFEKYDDNSDWNLDEYSQFYLRKDLREIKNVRTTNIYAQTT